MIGAARAFARNHPTVFWTVIGLGLALAIFVVVWFQPQKLFIEERVDEPIPEAAVAEETNVEDVSSEEGNGGSEEEPLILAAGQFQSLEHGTTGRAVLLELRDGRRYLRFEDLATSNGPDLRVYLSEIPASDDWYAYGKRFVDLGALQGNLGNQNYELPDDLDFSKYKSAVIWCRRFTVGFGVAPLEMA